MEATLRGRPAIARRRLRRAPIASPPLSALVAPLLAGSCLFAALLVTQLWVRVPQLQVAIADGQARVTAVAVGSQAWSLGARPGMVGPAWGGGAGQGVDLAIDGAVVGVAVAGPPAPPSVLVLAVALLAVGLLLPALGLPGRALLVTLAGGVALGAVYDRVGLPGAYPLVLIPLVTGFAANRRRRSLFLVVSCAAVVATVALANVIGDVSWPLVWTVPALAGCVVAVDHRAIRRAASRVKRRGWRRNGGLQAVVAELVPAARVERLRAVDAERGRIATAIHNDVLPTVVESLHAVAAGTPVRARAALGQLGDDLRALMLARDTTVLQAAGLVAALRSLVAVAKRHGAPMWLTVEADEGRPPLSVELSLYRIAQAAVRNAIDHSGAERIVVSVASSPRWAAVTISDDGVGIDATARSEARERGHVGLAEMEARAAATGAALEIKSGREAGTIVAVRWRS